MSEEDNVDNALSEVKKILELLSKNKSEASNPEIVNAILSKLDVLENKVESFSDETDELLSNFGMTKGRMSEVVKEVPKDVFGDEKEALQKAHELKNEVLKMREEFARDAGIAVEAVKDQDPGKKKKRVEKKLSKEEHRQKYKRLGSSKKWKPL